MDEPRRFSVRTNALQPVGLTGDEFADVLESLVDMLGPHTYLFMPTELQTPDEVQAALNLEAKMRALSKHPGFEEFVKTIAGSTRPHSMFVADLASELQDHVHGLRFEEQSTTGKPADIWIDDEEGPVHIECKTFAQAQPKFVDNHQDWFRAILPAVDGELAMRLRYTDMPPLGTMKDLVQRIVARAASATGPGTIMASPALHVELQKPDGLAATRRTLNIPAVGVWGSSHDLSEGITWPLSLLGYEDLQLEVTGPLEDSSRRLQEKLDQTLRQAPRDIPFVAALDAEELYGSWHDQRTAIAKRFQPDLNTRISGVLLRRGPSKRHGPPWIRWYPNPYARNPIPSNLQEALRELERLDA